MNIYLIKRTILSVSIPAFLINTSCENNGCDIACNNWESLNEDKCECIVNIELRCQNGFRDGDEEDVDCGGDCDPCLTDIDGNNYKVTKIGNQVWMAENLKATLYENGMKIPMIENDWSWSNLDSADRAFCYYNNYHDNSEKYGALYTWAAATNMSAGHSNDGSIIQGVCPAGWHLPSEEEWNSMLYFLSTIDISNIAGMMMSSDTSIWNSNLENVNNSSGFTGLPGGVRDSGGGFFHLGDYGYWWSSSSYDNYRAWCFNLSYDKKVSGWLNAKNSGFSVRCVKD